MASIVLQSCPPSLRNLVNPLLPNWGSPRSTCKLIALNRFLVEVLHVEHEHVGQSVVQHHQRTRYNTYCASSRVAQPRKHGYSRWNHVTLLYTSWDFRLFPIYFQLMVAIVDLPVTLTSESMHNTITVLLDPENLRDAFEAPLIFLKKLNSCVAVFILDLRLTPTLYSVHISPVLGSTNEHGFILVPCIEPKAYVFFMPASGMWLSSWFPSSKSNFEYLPSSKNRVKKFSTVPTIDGILSNPPPGHQRQKNSRAAEG